MLQSALELSSNDKTALVSRSKFYLLLGQPCLALKDAEVALNEDSTYLKAIYQKAEALYHPGDFKHSLVFYHRGLCVPPQLEQFRLGVQKSIENAIGKMKDTAVVIQQIGWGDKRQATMTGTANGGGGGVGDSRGSTNAVTGSTARRKEAAMRSYIRSHNIESQLKSYFHNKQKINPQCHETHYEISCPKNPKYCINSFILCY